MQLQIDGVSVVAQPEQTLLELVMQLGLDSRCFSARPIAAKIAGRYLTSTTYRYAKRI